MFIINLIKYQAAIFRMLKLVVFLIVTCEVPPRGTPNTALDDWRNNSSWHTSWSKITHLRTTMLS